MRMLYALVALFSIVVRQFFLPNPFECFGDYAVLINWIAEPVMYAIAFGLVGLVYKKGECPFLGSILYLCAYALLIGALWALGIFSFAWWWILTVAVSICFILWGVFRAIERLSQW